MKIKIHPKSEQCQYIVDKENRTVVCVIHYTKNLFRQACIEQGIGPVMQIIPEKYLIKIMQMPVQFRGIAKCAQEDEWDEVTGRKLAFARAKYKLDKSFFNHASLFFNKVDHILDNFYTTINQYGEEIEQQHDKRVQSLRDKFGEEFVLFKKN